MVDSENKHFKYAIISSLNCIHGKESRCQSFRFFHDKRCQGSHYLGDLSKHFFQVQEGNGYPSEEQDA